MVEKEEGRKTAKMNSGWVSPTFLSDVTLFFAYMFLTLIVELGVFSGYMILAEKEQKEALKLFLVVLIANFASFLVGLALLYGSPLLMALMLVVSLAFVIKRFV